MNRFAIPLVFVVLVSCLVADPALAVLCDAAANKSCTSIPSASTGGAIAGLVGSGSWNGGDYDCSGYGTNSVVVTRLSATSLPPPNALDMEKLLPHSDTFTSYAGTQRGITFDVIPGPGTATPHYMEFRLVNPATVGGVQIDIYMKICAAPGAACNATSETLLPNGITNFGEIRITTFNVPGPPAPTAGAASGIPALGTIYRIVLGLSVLVGALWLILRRST